MGLCKKSRRRKFNAAPGRHSVIAKRRYARASQKIQQLVRNFQAKKLRTRPYKIVRHVVCDNGQKKVTLIVKRIRHYSADSKTSRLRSVLCEDSGQGDVKLSLHSQPLDDKLDGYRLVNLRLLQSHISDIALHSSVCKNAQNFSSKNSTSPVKLSFEKNQCGLSSQFVAVCVCGERFIMSTSPKTTLEDIAYPDVNLRAVWGTVATGGGASSLNERCATFNMPGISQSYFSALESKIGSAWSTCLEEDMLRAGIQERELAIQRGDFFDGVPAITVVCDGGWSKRSHKHTYNALGGVGVIFGAATGKILHVGVRNKMCYTCTLAETRKVDPTPHTCFRNWNESSQAMEADIIVEGFNKAESIHGVRYMRIIADGDSSVFAKIQECVPVWGQHVQKLECANHTCKCLRSSLEKLVEEKPHYKGKGGLSKTTRVRLVTAVRCAIRMRSAENNKTRALRMLDRDIRNSIHHIFGDHSRCSDFCKQRTRNEDKSRVTDDTSIAESEVGEEENDEITAVLEEQTGYWKEGTSEQELEESRYALTSEFSLECDMLRDISILLDRVASKSKRLMGNFTTNLVESWMSIRAKFDGGKYFNRCNRGSWNGRCYGGALRKNFGPGWSPIVWQKITSTRPGNHFTTHYHRRSQDLLKSARSKNKPDVKDRRRKRKMTSLTQCRSKKARKEYGLDAVQVIPDVEPSELVKNCQEYKNKHIQLTDHQCKKIEELTRNQSVSVTWKEERRKRLTSSVFGEVLHRNPKLPIKKFVSRLLYGSFSGTRYTRQGLQSEHTTIQEYTEMKRKQNDEIKVEKCGLVIDLEHKYLAASPDGVVTSLKSGERGLVEVKNLLQKNQLSFNEACVKINGFCLEISNGKMQLKHNHNYYYQVQGQMNILGLPWVDLVVRRTSPYEIHLERIHRDEDLWNRVMVPKLSAFYHKALLPELAVPREKTSTGIREPDLPWYIGDKLETKHSKTNKSQRGTQKVKTRKKPQAGSSSGNNAQPSTSGNTTQLTTTRSRRRTATKFVGRRILHEWCVDESTGKTEWYQGRVLDVLKGKDGQANAVYEVKYDGENAPHEVDNLHEDYASSSLKFIDL